MTLLKASELAAFRVQATISVEAVEVISLGFKCVSVAVKVIVFRLNQEVFVAIFDQKADLMFYHFKVFLCQEVKNFTECIC